MLVLRRRLRRRGHRVQLFGYLPTAEGLDSVSDRLARRVMETIGGRPYALAGHSLGTVVIRAAMARGLASNPPRHCFFMAPPMAACKAAKFFSGFMAYRVLTGQMGSLLAQDDFMRDLPMPGNLTVYAGTAGPTGPLSPFGEEPNDGILSLSEASGPDGVQTIQVPALHTFIMNSRLVSDDIARRLSGLDGDAALAAAGKTHAGSSDERQIGAP